MLTLAWAETLAVGVKPAAFGCPSNCGAWDAATAIIRKRDPTIALHITSFAQHS